jgi:oxaloacetate decarboxylase alpha subunit/pyruvate carboxylase subunit B
MPGTVIRYQVDVGDKVKAGDIVVMLEAMKMENAIPAPADGVIKAVNFGPGASVKKGDVLAIIAK